MRPEYDVLSRARSRKYQDDRPFSYRAEDPGNGRRAKDIYLKARLYCCRDAGRVADARTWRGESVGNEEEVRTCTGCQCHYYPYLDLQLVPRRLTSDETACKVACI